MTYFLVFVCGLLTALPYVFDFLFFVPYFSVAVLLILTLKNKRPYLHGLCFSMGYYLVVYHWFVYLYPLDFAGLSELSSLGLIILAIFGLSFIQAISSALVPLAVKYLTKDRHIIFVPFTAASIWCLIEWTQNFFWFGVPWARLSLTQYKILPIIQSASVIGSLGISFFIVLISGFICIGYLSHRNNGRCKLWYIVACTVFALNFAFGTAVLLLPDKKDESIPAAVIQGNISSSDKWADDSVYNSLNVYTELTREAAENNGAKIIVWPETVLITDLSSDSYAKEAVSTLSKELSAYIAVGAFYAENGRTFNAVYLFCPDGSINENIYCKRHLVPFGEYLPMADTLYKLFPFLSEVNLISEQIYEGASPKLFETEIGYLASLICFDSIYDSLAYDSAKDGANLFLISTNDSWYKDSAAVRQHNAHAVMRSIENGRYTLRSANTGISSIITDKGQVLSYIPPLESGYICENVSLCSHKTIYSYIGNLVVYLSIVFLLYLAAHKIYYKAKSLTKS